MRAIVGAACLAVVLAGCGDDGNGSAGDEPVPIPSAALQAGLRVSLTATPAKAGSRTVRFSAPVEDDDGTAPVYTVDFGDGATGKSSGSAVACPTGKRASATPVKTTITLTHTYKAAGSYPVQIEITTGAGCTAPATETQTALALVTVP